MSFTNYDHVVTGIGDSWSEAISDALDMLCQSHADLDTDGVCNRVTDDMLSDLERSGENPDDCQIDEDMDDDIHVFISIRYTLEDCDDIPADWMSEYRYYGDVDLSYGGQFFDLSGWDDGYVEVVEVVDLGSACGAGGFYLVEHKTVLVDRWSIQGWGETRSRWDNWSSALSCCGPEVSDLLTWDREAQQLALSAALCGYGRYDADDAWDNYQTGAITLVAVGHRGEVPDDSPNWSSTPDIRLYSTRELVELVLREHVTSTGFCCDREEVANV